MNVTIFVNLNLKNISCTCIRLFGNPILRIMQSMLLIHLLGCGSDYVVSSVHTVTNVNSLFFVKNLIFFCALNKNWMTNRSNPMLESFSRVLLFLATFKEMPIFHLQWFTLRKKNCNQFARTVLLRKLFFASTTAFPSFEKKTVGYLTCNINSIKADFKKWPY